ncbi:hypothetical protein BDK51DRAFT_34864 [Blyttiomyces helicus]|uniref:Uncharacterized protein n=1 Tax=Blyttiomyces helicus TaxID=388810 RepID=A0A4P9W436_9FUNG|nr:hypothetical protein BDK51DRAFT_34864 [Blyttiomyces helicus]|eukprot:RKO86934.1 hypothetical protein BDK51DRAFT_34864 [Blyttiomyces helicus]
MYMGRLRVTSLRWAKRETSGSLVSSVNPSRRRNTASKSNFCGVAKMPKALDPWQRDSGQRHLRIKLLSLLVYPFFSHEQPLVIVGCPHVRTRKGVETTNPAGVGRPRQRGEKKRIYVDYVPKYVEVLATHAEVLAMYSDEEGLEGEEGTERKVEAGVGGSVRNQWRRKPRPGDGEANRGREPSVAVTVPECCSLVDLSVPGTRCMTALRRGKRRSGGEEAPARAKRAPNVEGVKLGWVSSVALMSAAALAVRFHFDIPGLSKRTRGAAIPLLFGVFCKPPAAHLRGIIGKGFRVLDEMHLNGPPRLEVTELPSVRQIASVDAIRNIAGVWPSGLRRYVQVVVSKEATFFQDQTPEDEHVVETESTEQHTLLRCRIKLLGFRRRAEPKFVPEFRREIGLMPRCQRRSSARTHHFVIIVGGW